MRGIRWLHLGQDFNVRAHPLDPGAPDKDCVDGRNKGILGAEFEPLEFQVRFEGLALPAECVAPYCDVQSAERLLWSAGQVRGRVGDVLGEQDHAGAGTIGRHACGNTFPQRAGQFESPGKFVDGG